MPSHHSIVIFSGGTAANHLVDIFESIRKSKDCPISYIIPISDNGGSSSELIRVFGGPGIGDVRSRLVRLIPRLPPGSPDYKEREAIRALFNYRLSSTDARTAKMDWTEVVDGMSHLWKHVSSAKKELIRSFFNLVNSEITKRSRPPSNTFDFTSASVGNLFLTGARLFSGSFESAIYLLGSICGIIDEGIKVIPSINSNFSHHIAAGLEDGTVIVGQNAISHPSPDTLGVPSIVSPTRATNGPSEAIGPGYLRRTSTIDHYYGDEQEIENEYHEGHEEEDANLPGSLPTLRTKNINFNKDAHLNEELPARISRIWYINPYGQEILPPANPRAVQAITHAQAVIYSIGSLYTSLAPSLILRGIGDALRHNTSAGGTAIRTKILILNGSLDREVGPQAPHAGSNGTTFSAVDFVEAIVRAGEQSRGVVWEPEDSNTEYNAFGAHDTADTSASADFMKESDSTKPSSASKKSRPALSSSKSENIIRTTLKSSDPTATSTLHRPQQQHLQHLFPPPLPASTVNSQAPSREGSPSSSPTTTTPHNEPNISNSKSQPKTKPPSKIYTKYITHLIHLPNSPNTPYVDRSLLLSKYGIHTVKVYGRTSPDGQGMLYDHIALRSAIEAILGRRAERVDHRTAAAEMSANDALGSGNGDSRGAEGRSRMLERGADVPGEEWRWRGPGVARRNTLNQ